MYPLVLAAMEELGEERRYDIRYALASYMEDAEERNMTMIHRLGKRALDRPVDTSLSEEDAWEEKRRWFASKFALWNDDDTEDLPLTPEEFLNVRWPENLVELWGLHGVEGIRRHSLDVEVDVREKYFATVRDRIAGLPLTGEHCPQTMPADLVYLSCLVDVVHGPGFPDWRDMHGIHMISSTLNKRNFWRFPDDPHLLQVSPGADLVGGSNRPQPLDFLWHGWKKSVAFPIGIGQRYKGSYAIFCRRLRDAERWDDEDDEPDPDDESEQQVWKDTDVRWQWRFGARDDMRGSELFDTVEEFLAWFANCKEPAAEKWWSGEGDEYS